MKRKTWNRILACVLALVMLVSTVIYDGSRSKAEGDGDNPADQTVDQTADQLGTQTADQTSNQTGTISIEIPAEAKDYTWSYKLDENEYATGTVASAGSGDDAVYRVEVPDVTAGDHSLTIKVNDGTNDYVSGSQSIAVTAGEATKYSAALNSDGGTYKVNLTEVVPPAPPVSKYEVKAAVTGADGYSGGVLNYKDASDASATYAQVPSEGLAAGTYTFQYVGAAGYQLAGEGATKTEDSDAGKANWKTTITYESVAISANKTFNITATPIYEVSVTGGAVKYTDGTEKTIPAGGSVYLKKGSYTFSSQTEDNAIQFKGGLSSEKYYEDVKAECDLKGDLSIEVDISEPKITNITQVSISEKIYPHIEYELNDLGCDCIIETDTKVTADKKNELENKLKAKITYSIAALNGTEVSVVGEKIIYQPKDKIAKQFQIKLKAACDSVSLEENVDVNTQIAKVQYGDDFIIKNSESSNVSYKDKEQIFYYKPMGTDHAVVLKSKNYKNYRYKYGNGKWDPQNGFSPIGDNDNDNTIIQFNQPSIVLQMKDNVKFGTTGELEIKEDDKAPTFELQYTDTKNIEKTMTAGTPNIITATNTVKIMNLKDNDGGSGFKSVSYSLDNSGPCVVKTADEDIEITDIADGLHTLKITTHDNVNNTSGEITYQFTVDTTPPEITVNSKNEEEKDNNGNVVKRLGYVNLSKLGNTDVVIDFNVKDKTTNLNAVKIQGECLNNEIDKKPSSKKEVNIQIKKEDLTNWIKNIIDNNGKYKDGTYDITFYAEDEAGNTTNIIYTLVVDSTPPNITKIEFFNQIEERKKSAGDVQNKTGNITQNIAFNKTMEVTATDLNIANVTAKDGDKEIKKNASGTPVEFNNVDFGDYFYDKTITITATDKAGNEATTYGSTEDSKAEAKFEHVSFVNKKTSLNGITFADKNKQTKNNKHYVILDADTKEAEIVTTITPEAFIKDLLVVELYKKDGDTESYSGSDVSTSIRHSFAGAKDGEYKLKAYYTDIARGQNGKNGSYLSAASDWFILDNTVPELEAAMTDGAGNAISNGATANKVTLTYTLTEVNPDFENFVFTTIKAAKNSNSKDNPKVTCNGKETTLNELPGIVMKEETWIPKPDSDNTYTMTLTFDKDDKIETGLTVQDVLGHTASADNRFTVDTAAPEITSVAIDTKYEDLANEDYKKFDPKKALVTVELIEEIASAKENASAEKENISVFCTAKDDVMNQSKDITLICDTKKSSKENFVYTFEIDKDFKGSISFTTRDAINEGGSAGVSIANGVIVESLDKHKATSTQKISENGKPNANNFYNKDVSLKLEAEDTFSGMKQVAYEINGAKTTVDFGKENTIRTAWTKTPVLIKATKANEGNEIKVSLEVTDNAGHVDSTEETYKIDITKPDISVAYDTDAAQNEKYYKDTRTATITIKELNFDEKNTVITVVKNGVSSTVPARFSTNNQIEKLSDGTEYKTYTMSLPFAEDGDYTFSVTSTDLAGNKAEHEEATEFTIDKTLPTMTITYNNNSPYKEQYYGEGRTATITVNEHNFDPAGIVVNVSASVDGGAVAAPGVSAFSTNGDVHTATVAFNQDADYTISATSLDLAGNVGDSIAEQRFTIDLTAPEITITGVEANTSYTGSVSPVVTVSDGNYDMAGVSVQIVGGKNGLIEGLEPAVEAADHGQSYTYPDLQHTENYDDCYVITATATDMAGHQTETTMNYRVNRFGSVYTLSDDLAQAVENYYTNVEGKSFEVYETNVDKLEEHTLSYSIDGEIVTMVEGTDYTVTEATNADQWMQYTYALKEDSFSKEGVYIITVSSKDEVGNITDNRSKNVPMEFVIDNTAPSCVISGVSEGQRFEKDAEINIGVEVFDNIKLDRISVNVNGEEKYTQDDFTDGKISGIEIDRSKRDQEITVTCYDAAGNETVETVNFIYNIGFMGIPVWIWIILISVGAAAAIFFIVLAKRNKKDKAA